MGVRILAGDDMAAIYCSTSDFAFGPVFHGDEARDKAHSYLIFIAETDGRDPRTIPDGDLERMLGEWMAAKTDMAGNLTDEAAIEVGMA